MYYDTTAGRIQCYEGTTWGNCGNTTLQEAYNSSANSATTPEILLDSTRKSLDVQDANTTIGATEGLLNVRASATGALGASLFVVQGNGRVGINNGSTGTAPAVSYDLSFGGNADRTIGLETTTGTTGGKLTVTAGNGLTTGVGGAVAIQAGTGGATGGGGAVTLQGGTGGATSGAGGLVTIQGGNATAGASNGGGVSILAGASTTTGTAGAITVTAGAGVAGSNTAGGVINITSGAGGGSAAGGLLTILGGQGGATGTGAGVTVRAGAGGAPFPAIAENPERLAPVFMVLSPLLVNVPVPLIVPFRTKLSGIVGLFPTGSEQLLLMVFVLVCPVNETRLKVMLLQLRVAILLLNVTVPELWLKVPPVTVNAPGTVQLPEVAVKTPPLKLYEAVVKVDEPPLNDPAAWL
jgi:hypothetical protein